MRSTAIIAVLLSAAGVLNQVVEATRVTGEHRMGNSKPQQQQGRNLNWGIAKGKGKSSKTVKHPGHEVDKPVALSGPKKGAKGGLGAGDAPKIVKKPPPKPKAISVNKNGGGGGSTDDKWGGGGSDDDATDDKGNKWGDDDSTEHDDDNWSGSSSKKKDDDKWDGDDGKKNKWGGNKKNKWGNKKNKWTYEPTASPTSYSCSCSRDFTDQICADCLQGYYCPDEYCAEECCEVKTCKCSQYTYDACYSCYNGNKCADKDCAAACCTDYGEDSSSYSPRLDESSSSSSSATSRNATNSTSSSSLNKANYRSNTASVMGQSVLSNAMLPYYVLAALLVCTVMAIGFIVMSSRAASDSDDKNESFTTGERANRSGPITKMMRQKVRGDSSAASSSGSSDFR